MVYDDMDDDDELLTSEEITEEQEIQETTSNQETVSDTEEDLEVDVIATLLHDRGVTDMSKLQFEDDKGNVVEKKWEDLTSAEQLQVLRSSTPDVNDELDESEILFLNLLRTNNLSPKDYIDYVSTQAVENYKKSLEETTPAYTIDLYSDDELYVLDLVNRTGISLEEAEELLAQSKTNEALFNKQVTALREGYKKLEEEYIKYNQLQTELQEQENFNRFAQAIHLEVDNFNSIAGGSLNMSNEDKSRIYEFLTGTDKAGNNWFRKALEDPAEVVKMAWFVLNGEQAFLDILDYYNSEILKLSNPIQNLKKPISNIIYKPKSTKTSSHYDDLDDEF